MQSNICPLHTTETELAQSFKRLRDAASGADRLEAEIALAWDLRQRDSRRARALVAPVLKAARKTATTLRAYLIEAEIACLFDEQNAADAALSRAEMLILQLNPDAILQGDTLLCKAFLQALRGDLINGSKTLEQCIEIYATCADPLRELIGIAWFCYLESFQNPESCRARLAMLKLRAPQFAHQPALAAYIYAAEGMANFWRNPSLAVALELKATIASGQAGIRRLAINCDMNASWILHSLGDLEAASECIERVVSEANESGWPTSICTSQTRLGALLRDLGSLDQSRAALESAIAIFPNSQSSVAIANAHSTLGHTLFLQGELPAAIKNYERSIAICRQSQTFDNLIEALIDYARTLSAANKLDPALQAIKEASFVIGMYGFTERIVALNEALAEIYTAHKMPAPADALAKSADAHFLQAALDHGQTLADWQPKANLLKKLAASYAKLGEHAKAYMYALRALNAEQSASTKQAASRSAAMQIREQTEQARNESQRQRELTEVAEHNLQLLNTLSAMGQEITANLNATAIATTLATQLRSFNIASHLRLWLRDTDRAVYSLRYSNPLSVPVNNRPLQNDDDQAAKTIELSHLRTETIIDATSDKCTFYAPLLIQKKTLAIVEIAAPAPLPPASISIFRSLNAYVAIALENARTYQALADAKNRIEQLSQTDSLTGIFNRHYVNTHIASLLAETQNETCLAIFLIDIDHFKTINDTHGQSEGDLVLQQMPVRLAQAFGTDAILVRWDAAGFLVLRKNTPRNQCAIFAKALNNATTATPFGLRDGAPIKKTCSIGFACYPPDPHYPETFSWQQALNFADLALKHAKQTGRNCAVGLTTIDSRQAGSKNFVLPWEMVPP